MYAQLRAVSDNTCLEKKLFMFATFQFVVYFILLFAVLHYGWHIQFDRTI